MIADAAITDAVTLLDKNPDYKVVRRIAPRKAFAENDGRALLKGVVVDTETTGINPDQDAIIELGMVLFEFDPETGLAYNVIGVNACLKVHQSLRAEVHQFKTCF